MPISIKITGINKTKAMYNSAARAIRNAKPAMSEIARMQNRAIQDNFKTEGKTITKKSWKPLKPSTVKDKIKKGYTTSKLVRTGKMKSNFSIFSLTGNKIVIGNNTPYYAKHQQGERGSTFKAAIPQRQMLGHSEKMSRDALAIFKKFVETSIKRAI